MANQQKQMPKPTKAQQEALKKQQELAALIERNVKEFKEFILMVDLPQRFITTGFLMLDGDHNYMVINVNPWSSLADTKFMMRTHNFLHGMPAEENNGFTPPENYKIFELPRSISPVFLTSSDNAGVYLGVFLAEALFNNSNEKNTSLSVRLFDAVPSLTALACKTKIYFGSGSSFTNDLTFVAYPINGDVNKASVSVADIGYETYIVRLNGEKVTTPFSRLVLWDSESKNKARKAIEIDYSVLASEVATSNFNSLKNSMSSLITNITNPAFSGSMTRQKFSKSVASGELKDAKSGTVVKLTDGKTPKYKFRVGKVWVDLPIA